MLVYIYKCKKYKIDLKYYLKNLVRNKNEKNKYRWSGGY